MTTDRLEDDKKEPKSIDSSESGADVWQDVAGIDEDGANSVANGDGESDRGDSKGVNDRVAQLEAEVAELGARLLRAQADFDNFRRRARQEREELLQFGVSRLVSALLPTIDNFERAIASGASGGADTLLKGIEMVWRDLLETLEKEGLRPMETVGQAFDPSLHEAVMQVEDASQPSGHVVEEFQRGYYFKEKVLRPAMVKVSQ